MIKSANSLAGCIAIFLLTASCSFSNAQEYSGKGLPALVEGNERFGRNLLQQEHAGSPGKNIVLSPVSLTLTFAALDTYSWSEGVAAELNHVFGWARPIRLALSARQLLAVLEPPKPISCKPTTAATAKAKRLHLKTACSSGVAESAWIANTLLYRSTPQVKDPIPGYVRDGMQRDFGFTFVNTNSRPPGAQDLRKARGEMGLLPQRGSQATSMKPNDVWVSSGVHLKTAWRGNTFSMSTPRPGEFQAFSGLPTKVTLVDSELELYFYAKTSTFEAVALPGNLAYMVIVLPAPGSSIAQLEQELATQPDALDVALKKRVGIVTMPAFHMIYSADVSKSIKALGVTTPFKNLDSMISIQDSHLTQVAQRVDIQVDKEGIRANSETISGMVYGGILVANDPFHMMVDRPFLFLIRDQTTNALLFIGALMDPGESVMDPVKK